MSGVAGVIVRAALVALAAAAVYAMGGGYVLASIARAVARYLVH